MKRIVFTLAMACAILTTMGQESYIVKTKNVKPVASVGLSSEDASEYESAELQDFVSKNFKFRSMCDWQEGMRFMVVPEKYDLVVNTFRDAETNKEVSNGKLRYKIMVYRNHTKGSNGREQINFVCQDDGRIYYYELPNGDFEDYCYGKQGVPTLAYLDDVDKARDLLLGQTLITRQPIFYIDTQYEGDGMEEVRIPENTEVVVKHIGVGTRKYPVKIIVEDPKTGKEFFQHVVMSRTNNGMRDEDFEMDNKKYLFLNSFEVVFGTQMVSTDFTQYIGKTIYSKVPVEMISKGDGRIRNVKVPRLTEFIIDDISAVGNSRNVMMTLTESESRRVYLKEVTFVSDDVATAPANYFGTLFGFGEGKLRNSSRETRAMIRQGRVGGGMTEEEVELAMGEPDSKTVNADGLQEWIYKRTKKLFIVQFDNQGKVAKLRTTELNPKTKKKK